MNATWQAIETAPKDGTLVLLCGGKTDKLDYLNEIPQYLMRPVTAFWNARFKEWWFAYWDVLWRSRYDNPTHWMPIPELPTSPAP